MSITRAERDHPTEARTAAVRRRLVTGVLDSIRPGWDVNAGPGTVGCAAADAINDMAIPAEKPVDTVPSSWDVEKYGGYTVHALQTRVKMTVDALDTHFPGWYARYADIKPRGHFGVNIADAIEKAAQELEMLRSQASATPETAPHPDAPTQHLDGTVTYPQWEGSYTQEVVGDLVDVDALKVKLYKKDPYSPRGWGAKSYFSEVLRRAADLLKDYHATQHLVYEGRDAARKEAQELKAENAKLQAQTNALVYTDTTFLHEINKITAERDAARKEMQALKAENAKLQAQAGLRVEINHGLGSYYTNKVLLREIEQLIAERDVARSTIAKIRAAFQRGKGPHNEGVRAVNEASTLAKNYVETHTMETHS